MCVRKSVARVSCIVLSCMLGLVAMSCTATLGRAEAIEITTGLPPLVQERLGAGTVLGDDGCIYVFGGYQYNYTSFDSTTSTVMIYNITTGMTSFGTGMTTSVAWPSCAKLLDGRIAIIGGYDSTVSNGTKNVRIYSPKTDSWTTNATAPTNISKASTALGSDGKVYVFGPWGSENSTLIFDPVGNAWSYGADLPSGRDRHGSSAVVCNATSIYVIGGHRITWVMTGPSTWVPIPTDTNYVDIYNPVADSWTVASSLNTAKHSGGAALAKDGRIHYYGGQQWIGICYDDIEILDVSSPSASWQVSNSTISTTKAHFGTVADEHRRVFLVGGMEFPSYSGIDDVEMLLTVEVSEISEIVISNPIDGADVNGTVAIEVEVKNQHQASAVTVDLYVDDELLESQLGGGATAWTFLWNASGLSLNSTHDVTARAFFSDGSISVDEASYTVASESADDGIDDRLDQIEDDIAAIFDAMSVLDASIDVLLLLTESLDDNVTDLAADLGSLGGSIESLQTDLEALAQAVADLPSSIELDLSSVSADIDALSDALDVLAASVQEIQAAMAELAQQPGLDLDEVIEDLESLMDAVDDLNNTVDDIDESVGEAQGSADDASTFAMAAMAIAAVILVAFVLGTFLLRRKPQGGT